mmetsp:Transcript_87468/g.242623  ORF Transcript_87468/g.242623 Transcript_87468/m.242623 type:complete len:220 (-) Transcript_87468:804-1463(-)
MLKAEVVWDPSCMLCSPEGSRDSHVHPQHAVSLDVQHLQARRNGLPTLAVLWEVQHIHCNILFAPRIGLGPLLLSPRLAHAEVWPVADLGELQWEEWSSRNRRRVALLRGRFLDGGPGSVRLQLGVALSFEADPTPVPLEGVPRPPVSLLLLLTDPPPCNAKPPSTWLAHFRYRGRQVASQRIWLDESGRTGFHCPPCCLLVGAGCLRTWSPPTMRALE